MDVTPHPNGIKPSGNHIDHAYGGHDPFRLLPDEIIYNLLQILPSPKDVLNFSHTCKKIYAFSLSEELWKEIYTARKSDAPWKGTWRASFLRLGEESKIQVADTYSDLLFKPYLNSQIDLAKLVLPKGTKRKRKAAEIDRYTHMSLADFTANHTHKPFILTEEVRHWPAMTRWTVDSLLARFGDTVFRAECVDWTLAQYVAYMNDNRDESPLYLFDAYFAQKTAKTEEGFEGASLADDYTVPECFSEDAFDLLSPAERPDHRWLIVGPRHSGSTFHKDPNGTCAWNAVVTGKKYWIMFPPSSLPPGVFTSADESEVTAPESIAEWLLTYHDAAVASPGCLTGVCHAGEVLFVPSGWWHLVVNLEPGIAVTQNFVPRTTIGRVLAFLRDRGEQVSGFRRDVADPYGLFEARVREAYPAEWAAATASKTSRWHQLTKTHDDKETNDSAVGGFTFDFDESDEDDDA